jgi:hypothetical protein
MVVSEMSLVFIPSLSSQNMIRLTTAYNMSLPKQTAMMVYSHSEWAEFLGIVKEEWPSIAHIVDQINLPDDQLPISKDFIYDTTWTNEAPRIFIKLTWTAEQCRLLFRTLAVGAQPYDIENPCSLAPLSEARDYWQFLSVLALGVKQGGIVSY